MMKTAAHSNHEGDDQVKLRISLKAARVNADLTQDQVARIMHKTKQTIVNWESGATEIKYKDLIALSELYNMPLEYIRMPERREKPKVNPEDKEEPNA